jgi:chloramphenicol-sensitive protein RarD
MVGILKGNIFFHLIKNKKQGWILFLASVLLGINWSVYLVGVMTNHVIECSLGYYINPLVSIVLGAVFLGEKFNKVKIVAVVLALCGVLILVVGYRRVPYFAFGVALSFGLYGLIKKQIDIEPLNSMLFEMSCLLPVALIVEIVFISNGTSVFVGGIKSIGFLMIILLTSVATVLPLILYNHGVRMLTLGNVGFLQFVTPTMMFFIGVAVNGEVFTRTHLISFVFIWVAVIIYCVSLIVRSRRLKETRRMSPTSSVGRIQVTVRQ